VLTTDVVDQNSLINFVLVGGGTGVELAGALAEMKKAILQKIIQILIFQNANPLFKVVIAS
jgi:NADH dehydrogenase FAD-containing subunit